MLAVISLCVHGSARSVGKLPSDTTRRDLERSGQRSASQFPDLARIATAAEFGLDDSYLAQRLLPCADSAKVRRGREVIIKDSMKYALTTSLVGYLLLVGSALIVSAAIRLITGYYPSFTYFTLSLMTFRLVELHYGFLLAPPLTALVVITLLSRTPVNVHVSAGIGLSSYYILVASMFLLTGAAEFSATSAIPMIVWAFIVGVGSSVVVHGVQTRSGSS